MGEWTDPGREGCCCRLPTAPAGSGPCAVPAWAGSGSACRRSGSPSRRPWPGCRTGTRAGPPRRHAEPPRSNIEGDPAWTRTPPRSSARRSTSAANQWVDAVPAAPGSPGRCLRHPVAASGRAKARGEAVVGGPLVPDPHPARHHTAWGTRFTLVGRCDVFRRTRPPEALGRQRPIQTEDHGHCLPSP